MVPYAAAAAAALPVVGNDADGVHLTDSVTFHSSDDGLQLAGHA